MLFRSTRINFRNCAKSNNEFVSSERSTILGTTKLRPRRRERIVSCNGIYSRERVEEGPFPLRIIRIYQWRSHWGNSSVSLLCMHVRTHEPTPLGRANAHVTRRHWESSALCRNISDYCRSPFTVNFKSPTDLIIKLLHLKFILIQRRGHSQFFSETCKKILRCYPKGNLFYQF